MNRDFGLIDINGSDMRCSVKLQEDPFVFSFLRDRYDLPIAADLLVILIIGIMQREHLYCMRKTDFFRIFIVSIQKSIIPVFGK